jgi:hypothetical protein
MPTSGRTGEDRDGAYEPLDPDAMGDPLVESDGDAVLQPGAEAFASPGVPSAGGDEDPSGQNADPQPSPEDLED